MTRSPLTSRELRPSSQPDDAPLLERSPDADPLEPRARAWLNRSDLRCDQIGRVDYFGPFGDPFVFVVDVYPVAGKRFRLHRELAEEFLERWGSFLLTGKPEVISVQLTRDPGRETSGGEAR